MLACLYGLEEYAVHTPDGLPWTELPDRCIVQLHWRKEPAFERLLQLLEGGDYEAVSTWYLGLDEGGCFRILTLSDPSRLVIDIEH